jgi:hypothetical protein
VAQSEVDTKIETEAQEKKDSRAQSVADYLQAPRRKRRSYVITALGARTLEFRAGIDAFIKTQYKNTSVANSRDVEDLLRSFKRKVLLLILDDEFVGIEESLQLALKFKKISKEASPPILFLTRNPELLIEGYRRVLAGFHEGDDYIHYPKFGLAHITSRIRAGLLFQYRRRSRRYRVSLDLQYYLLTDDQYHTGKIIDLSVHGGLIEAADGHVFRPGEQLKLHLPIFAGNGGHDKGEFLHLSARVRRVVISGTQAGISFEHMTEHQSLALTELVTDISRRQLAKRAAVARVQAVRK